jgi:hypothetical protein
MELQRDMDLVPSLIDSDLPSSSSFRAVWDNGLPKILGGLIVYLLSKSTVRSGWSHWVVMAAHHCYLWWSDTLWVSFGSHKVLWLHSWSCYHSQQLCKYLQFDLWRTFCLICHFPIGLVCGVWSSEMLSNLHLMVVISVQTILLWVLFTVFGVGGSANTSSVFELHRGQENLIKKSTNSISTNQEWPVHRTSDKVQPNGVTLSLDL